MILQSHPFFAGLLAAFALLSAPLAAQVSYPTPGRFYLQDFNHSEVRAAASFAWKDNETFPGWFVACYDGARETHATPPVILVTEGRGQAHIGVYLYRGTQAPHDAALGGQPTDEKCPGIGTGGICYALALRNDTGRTLTRFTLSYRVELWRLVANAALQTTLVASHRVGGEAWDDGEWTPIPDSSYVPTSPAPGVLPGNLDGNAPANVRSFGELIVNDLHIPAGEVLWLRWFDVNNRQADLGLGIDDVAVTIEP